MKLSIPFLFECLALAMLVPQYLLAQTVKASEPAEVTLTAQCDGSVQRYVQLLPADFTAEREYHVLIALHGHGSDRWQFVKDGRDECRAARDVAAKHGMIYISPDYRAGTSWMGPQAEADVVQIIADLRKQYHIGKVFIAGASMGGSSALTFTALHPELIAGVCAMNGTANHLEYRNFQDAIAASFGGNKEQIPLEYKKRSAEYWPEHFTMPVALTAGGADATVPPQSVQRLADVLSQMKRNVLLIYREHGGHSTDYTDGVNALEFMLCTALGLEYRAIGEKVP